MTQITATVIENKPYLYQRRSSGKRVLLGFRFLRLDCPQMERAWPGQFVMVNCGEKCILPRPFSIHQVTDNSIALWIAVWEDGLGTQWLAKRNKSETVGLIGPIGNGYGIHPEAKRLLLLAGGLGIVPLYFLAKEAVARQCSVTLIHGASSAANLYPKEMPQGISLVIVTEKEVGRKVTDILPDYVDSADQIFACGPNAMYQAMAQMPELKDKSVQISLEVIMGCGRGVCYGCTIKTKKGLKQICQDGPVFELDDVIWGELDY